MFRVQKRQCSTCIYKTSTPSHLRQLEQEIADPAMPGFFAGWRVCHHSKDVCCRGFYQRHKDHFTLGQLAQRLGWVEEVEVDLLAPPATPA